MLSALGSAGTVARPGRNDSASAKGMPGASPAAAAAGLIAASRWRPPVAATVAKGVSSAGAPAPRLGVKPVRFSPAHPLTDRRSRSIGQLGRKTYMTCRIRHLHLPLRRHAAAAAQQLDPPARPP